jgi:acyl-CoA thioesterase-1
MVHCGRRFDLIFILAAVLAGIALVGCSASEDHSNEFVALQMPVVSEASHSQPSPTVDAASKQPDSKIATEDNASVVPNDSWPVIACFGDSLTAGLGIDSRQSYPADLQRMLDGEGYHYRVVNAGVSGDTTKDGLERIGRLLAKRPSIVVLEFGGNDGLRGLPVRDAKQNMAQMIARLQKGRARVALAGIFLPPQYGGEYISQFNAMYPALAKQFHVPLLPFILENVWGVQGDIQPDGVHPTAQGAKQVAQNVKRLILPMLKK